MKWNAYINRKDENGEVQTDKHEFELENTYNMADCRAAIAHAAKLFNTDAENILCVPNDEA